MPLAGTRVVNDSVDVSGVRYAVLEVLRTEGGLERFVVGYRNEHSLHEVIAAPCIVAFGFSSREEAAGSPEACVSTVITQKQIPRPTVVKRVEEIQHGLHWAERRTKAGSASRTVRPFLVAFYSDVVATAILIFSSRNIISAAIRTFLAASS